MCMRYGLMRFHYNGYLHHKGGGGNCSTRPNEVLIKPSNLKCIWVAPSDYMDYKDMTTLMACNYLPPLHYLPYFADVYVYPADRFL